MRLTRHSLLARRSVPHGLSKRGLALESFELAAHARRHSLQTERAVFEPFQNSTSPDPSQAGKSLSECVVGGEACLAVAIAIGQARTRLVPPADFLDCLVG